MIVSSPPRNSLNNASKEGTFGGAGAGFVVSMKLCVKSPAPLCAVIVKWYVSLAVGAPLRVAVPLPLSLKMTPFGNAPDTDKLDVGEPVAAIVKLPL